MNWYIDVLKNYATFTGRARRKEYWMFQLFHTLAILLFAFIDGMLGGSGVIVMIYILALFVPTLAVSIRRLHDTNRSGWWLLISLVPFIGGIWFLVLTVLDSTPGANEYGESPKEAVAL